MRKYVIMGIQGSGKGTQSEMLAADLDLVHISVGDIFRWNVSNHTKIGALVQRVMAGGELVGDDLVESVVQQRLAEHDWNFGFIIDGFPRNARQAEFFLESYDIDGVIYLDMPDSEVRRRVLSRRLCAGCGMDYNLIAEQPGGARPVRFLRGRTGPAGRRHRGGAGGAAAGIPREDRPGPRYLPPQGVRDHGGRPVPEGGRAAGDQVEARPAAVHACQSAAETVSGAAQ